MYEASLKIWLGGLIAISFVLSLYLILNSDRLRNFLNSHNIPSPENIAMYCVVQMMLVAVDIITFFVFILFIKQ